MRSSHAAGLQRWVVKWAVALSVLLFVGITAENAWAQSRAADVGPTEMRSKLPPQLSTDSSTNRNSLISLTLQDSTLDYVLRTLAAQSRQHIIYDIANPAFGRRINVQLSNQRIANALTIVLRGTGLGMFIAPDGETIVIKTTSDSTAENRSKAQDGGIVSGRVIDSTTRKGVAGATVTIVGIRNTVVSASDGTFQFRGVPFGKQTVEVKLFGYKFRMTTVVVSDRVQPIVVVLSPVPTALSEVVTTATGRQKRVEIGNSVTSINVDSLIQTTAVSNLTDVLDAGRVPGLVVSRASGAPGAPARIRIRGINSINSTSDPIIIVDGVRVYSEQTNTAKNAEYSVLDRIDINTISTVEVVKGPSASALYGSDAANGVIVITTKKGVPGRTRWSFRTNQMRTTQPGRFPDLYYREGTPAKGGRPVHCVLGVECMNDTLYQFNPLDDPGMTILGTGLRGDYSASVSGGNGTINYSLTGSGGRNFGLLKMPDRDVALLTRQTGTQVPKWMRRPEENTTMAGTARIEVAVLPSFNLSFTTTIGRNIRETTPLSTALGVYQRATLADTSIVTGQITEFRRQDSYTDQSTRSAINGQWNQLDWLNVSGDVGYDASSRSTRELLRQGDCFFVTRCAYESAPGTDVTVLNNFDGKILFRQEQRGVATANLTANVRLPRWFGFRLTPYLGFNFVRTTASDFELRAFGLVSGATSALGADSSIGKMDQSTKVLFGSSFGTRVALFDRFYTSVGTRIDASNALGSRVQPTYPKLDLSYLISDEAWFPQRQISQLRLRFAYGHAGVQPDLGARDRVYGTVEGGTRSLVLKSIGNSRLRPERSAELESGFDIGIFQDRLNISVTHSSKLTRDAVVNVTIPASLGGTFMGSQAVNYGSVRNTSTELSVDMLVRESELLRWGVNASVSGTRNRIVSLSPDFQGDAAGSVNGTTVWSTRYVVGYPVGGRWIRPVLSYNDLNADGVITGDELLRSDSSVFIGGTLPRYSLSWGTQVGLWNQRLSITTAMQYTNGLVQANLAAVDNLGRIDNCTGSCAQSGSATTTLQATNDPSTSLADQVAVRSGHAFIRSVSSLRFTSLTLNWSMPSQIVQRFRATAMTIALKGDNLGIWSNYSGIDPNVNKSIVGNDIRDSGQLPQPRTWGLSVSINY